MTHRLPNAVSRTELGYLDGVTSAIQTQLDAKSPLSGPTFTGTVTLPSTTSIGNVSSTEIGYLDGITSAIQTQIDGKLSTGGGTLTGNLTLSSGDVIVSYSNSTWTSPSNNSVPQMEIKNSAAAATGHSNLYIHTSGASGGDPFITMYIDGVAGWSIGADNSDSDKFKIANSWADVGTSTALTIDTSNNATFSGVVSAPVGSASSPSYTFTGDTNTGMYSTADGLRLTAGGVEQVRLFNYGIPVLQTDGTIQSISYSGTQTGNANVATFAAPSVSSTYSSHIVAVECDRAGSTAYRFINCRSAASGTPDVEFYVRGDGATFADGAYTGTGADYAEYFEWDDGNVEGEDRRGITVTLVENKIMPASEGDVVIGVVSAAPTIVGDSAHERWAGKYLKDDYGTYLTDENDERILNEEWNEDLEYISREFRPEWDCIGLAGKLRVRKGQPVDQRWVKMRDISEDVEEWLVR